MTTHRLPVGLKKVNWFDGQQVTKDSLIDEQAQSVGIDSASVANFMGSGIIEHNLPARIIFDTQKLNTFQQGRFDGYGFDGINIYNGTPLTGLSDTVKGVQLYVELSDVKLDGSETTRVSIIGEAFDNTLIHDDLIFEENSFQITRGRYKTIKSIMFSDFAGNLFGSRKPALNDGYNFIGRCIIREAKSMETSFDTLIAYQNGTPNQFFNKFIPADSTKTIDDLLNDCIGVSHSASELNIGIGSSTQRSLIAGDVISRIGQKFKASGTNIQKISVLLATDGYAWSGQIVMSIHALQAQVSCAVDPVPDNLIDFDPEPSLVAQLTLNAEDLLNQGIVLSATSQKVDFVFTGSNISDPIRTPIEKNKFYIFTIGRSGNASTGVIKIEEAPNASEYGYMVSFDGSSWTNIYESDMWYKIYGDYIKTSNGIGYQNGIGVEVLSLKPNNFGVEETYVEGYIPFYTSMRNAPNYSLLEVSSEYSNPLQDPRTGDNVNSRVAPTPSISMISKTSLENLITLDENPLLLVEAEDNNPRGNPVSISGISSFPGLVYGNKIDIINPDADLRTNNLVGSLLRPNTASNYIYRIIKQELFQDSYGDVNGDGEITVVDFNTINQWISSGYQYDLSNPIHQQRIMDGHVSIEEILKADVNGDGIVDAADTLLISNYINGIISTFPVGSTFSRMRLTVETLTNPLSALANMPSMDSIFTTAPFTDVPFDIIYYRTWLPDRIEICDMRRLLPTSFSLSPRANEDSCNGGSNDFFIPNNIIIKGNMLNEYGSSYSVDFEMTHLSMIIPLTDSLGNPTVIDGYFGVNLFETFVAESSSGKTAYGFNALKYSDETYVQTTDFSKNRVKITVSIQSHSNTYSMPFGSNMDDIVGTSYNSSTSLLNLWLKNLYNDGYGNVLPALNTKILITIYLKKGKFINSPQVITAGQVRNLFNI